MTERPLLVGVRGFGRAGKTTAIVAAVGEVACFAPARPVPTYRLQPMQPVA
ncbi:MAG TPA: hypothetical protein VFN74_06515 [Chloroflexota bacterium]|jgi:hypothetical protein|nr:hypothetical protein [Chloroflexota bacterium]